MNKIALSEGALFLSMAIVTMGEGLRLTFFHGDRLAIYDALGPGPYLLALSMMLLAGGTVHLITNRKKGFDQKTISLDRATKKRLIGTIVNCALYIFLINIVGYSVSTFIFLFLQFMIQGITSWLTISILAFLVSMSYYLIFVRICQLVFPRGILTAEIFNFLGL